MTKFFKQLWADESGQGATEYILLLVAIVAVATIFGGRFKEAITTKINSVSEQITSFTQ